MSFKKNKRELHEGAEEGEAWLMSYADLITLLLAVFVLLFSLASVDKQKVATVTKAIASYLNTKTVDNAVSVGDVTLQERQLLALRLLTTYLDLGHPDQVLQKLLAIKESDESVRRLQALAERLGLYGNAKPTSQALKYEIVFPEKIAFKKNSPYMSNDGLRILKSLTPKLKETLLDKEKSIEILSEVDSQASPPPGFSSNHIFASARAEAVSLILQKSGIDPNKIRIIGKTTDTRTVVESSDNRKNSEQLDLGARLVISILTPEQQVQ